MNIGIYIENGGLNTLNASDSMIDQLAALAQVSLLSIRSMVEVLHSNLPVTVLIPCSSRYRLILRTPLPWT